MMNTARPSGSTVRLAILTGVDMKTFWSGTLPTKGSNSNSCPPLDRDTTASTYIFGAVCPKEGKGAALIMPACNTEAMNLHLAEIAATVAPAAHDILLVDH